ncbi:MAG: acyl-[Alphaproteobacteria bacterium]|nr:acyl-[ACP]--phospholipid O-acyltransferase [Alphaproteobacteria bacterium]
MNKDLWKGARFVPLLIVQFFGALNDNLFKNTLLTFVAFKVASDAQIASVYSNIIAGMFILPYFLFSALAGLIADKYNRAFLVRILKITELCLMIGAGVLFVTKSVPLLVILLFLMGTQSTFFGPIKYALLPQLLRSEELIAGNAYVEGSTYISIILGTILGTVLSVNASIALLIICSIVGMIAAYKIPNATGADENLQISFNLFKQISDNMKLIKSRAIIFRAIIGATWFWMIGAFFATNIFPLCGRYFKTEPLVVTVYLILFALGVGAGSLFCNKLLKGRISVLYVPMSSIGLSVCAFAIYWLANGYTTPAEIISATEFLKMTRSQMLALFMFGLAFFGGMYVVPLNALMQKRAPKNCVASIIAGNNIVNSLGMVLVAVLSAVLLGIGLDITELFLMTALASIAVTIYICRLLPDSLVRSFFYLILGTLFRVKIKGLENLENSGSKTLIIANHISLLDGLLAAVYLPRKLTFAIDSAWERRWFVRLFGGLVNFYPLNPTSPLAIRSLIEVINQGRTVMIFPEGRITVTGSLMKIFEGTGVVAEKSGANILPVRIDGPQYSKLSYIQKLVKAKMFPKVQLTVLPPRKINMETEGMSGRERRQAAALRLHDIMAEMIYDTTDIEMPLFNALLQAEKNYGGNRKMATDIGQKTLNYRQLLQKIYVLGRVYERVFAKEKYVGVLLPNSLVGLVSFFALHSVGKVPVMMNFSLGERQFTSCIKTVGLKKIITAHRFIETGKLQRLEDCADNTGCEKIYLEDLAAKITSADKLCGIARYLRRRKSTVKATDTAVILYTSGSEGLPKAVLLSHRNLLANTLQIHLAVPFNSSDVILNALPMFHSFGLTVGTLLPMLYGVKTYFYPSPLHYRIVPEIAYDIQATAVLGTDTFLYGYGRRAHPYDFFSVRFAVVGGEKLKERTAEMWFKKFGVRIFEGYGTTETAPVLAVNTPMFYKENTVGRLLTRIEHRLEKVNGVSEGGRLQVKGDNVMLGYMRADNPEVLDKADAWYDTGDIVKFDEDGFMSICGRAKRFAKIGGEMVSLTAIEQLLDQLYPEAKQGVIAVDDEKKGEKLVLITSKDDVTPAAIKKYFQTQGISELWIPREVVYTQHPPLLGSGKFDYVAATKLYNYSAS